MCTPEKLKCALLLLQLPYLPVYKSIPCISRPPIFDGKKRNFLISLLNVTNLVFFDFWKCGYTKNSGPQALNSFVVQQLLYNVGILSLSFEKVLRKSNM